MNTAPSIKGFAILCDTTGIIKKILKDDLELFSDGLIGKLFTNIVDSGTRIKSLNFLVEIKKNKIAVDCQLNFYYNDILVTRSCTGIAIDNEVLIISTNNIQEANDFIDQIFQINNEQVNVIRNLFTFRKPPTLKVVMFLIALLKNKL